MSRCEKAESYPSWRVQAGSGPLFPPPWNGDFSFPALFRRMKRKAAKIKMPHLPAVLRIILGHYQQQVGGAILPTRGWGKQGARLAAPGSQRRSGRKPGPTVLPEKRKAGSSGGTGGVIPPCCPCTAPCVAVDRRTAVSQQTRMSPLWNPCRRRVRPKS